MQSFEPPKAGERSLNVASVTCHASKAPVKSKDDESHGDKTKSLPDKISISLPLKQNEKAIQKKVPIVKIIPKPEIPASIEACDVSTLLDKFLEYEMNQNANAKMVKESSVTLTPVSSPSHKGSCNLTEALKVNKKPCVSSLMGLTPPVSPPSHHSVSSASTISATPVTSHSKCRKVMENKKQFNDAPVKNNSVEKISLTHKASSDKTVNNKTVMQNKMAATQKNEKPDISRNDSTYHSNKRAVVQEQRGRGSSEPPKSEESRMTALQSLKNKNPNFSTEARGDEISSGGGCQKHKRYYSSDDDDDEDKDYYNYKRAKYDTRDECYWSTSEEESDSGRRGHQPRRHKVYHSRRRHGSRSSSCDSDDNCSFYGKSGRHASNNKQEKRKDVEKKKENDNETPVYDIETERKMNFKLDRSFKETSTEKRKIVYVGNIKESATKGDIWRRFREYGPIEKVTVHYRTDGDNYSFVTFVDSSSALEAIEKGCKDPDLKHLDICFGGRRKFCGGSYVDFDSNTSYLEEKQMNGDVSLPQSKEEMDFDALLKMCQKRSR